MKRVLVLRAREDAERTARALEAAGFEPILAPVLEIAPTHARLPDGGFDAVLATSANAAQDLSRLKFNAPICVVGARTAEVATRFGHRSVVVASTAELLARALCDRHEAAPARFLYLAGHDRRAALESALRDAGHEVEVAVLYEAIAAPELAPAARDAIAGGAVFSALHFSRRSVEIFIRLTIEQGLGHRLAEMVHVAISENAGEPLAARGCRVCIAKAPDQESILAALIEVARAAESAS